MVRLVGLVGLVGAMAGCGGGDGAADAQGLDAGVDATPEGVIDAALSPMGLWHLTDGVLAGAAVVTDGPERTNLTLELNEDGVLAFGHAHAVAGHLYDEGTDGGIYFFHLEGPQGRTIVISDYDGMTLDWYTWERGTTERIHYSLPPTDLTYLRMTHHPADTLEVRGQVSFRSVGAGALVPIGTPRVGLIFLVRAPGLPNIIEVPGGDVPLAAGFGDEPADVVEFDLSRTEAPLGPEIVSFGSASAAIGLVVLYDDVNGNGQLDTLWTSCGAGQDCVRGLSPLAATYRHGESPELAASPYAFMREGWTPAARMSDRRVQDFTIGLVSLDRDAEPLPFDIVAPFDPATFHFSRYEL